MTEESKGEHRIATKNPENQALIDALVQLAEAMIASSVSNDDRKASFKATALRKAATNLAALPDKITDGKRLSKQGPHKVKGVGSGTAYYIDEWLTTGTIKETEQYQTKKEMADNKKKPSTVTPDRKHAKKNKQDDVVQINRAPVLALWVATVAEKQGYNAREAHTYGQWISGVFARSKGRSLGIIKEEEPQERQRKKQRTEQRERVEVFRNVKIPAETQENGDRLAIGTDSKAIDPTQVEYYLQGAFRDRLGDARSAMEYLADSFQDSNELRRRAYALYEEFRPAWKGWGQKSELDLQVIRDLAAK